MDSKLQNDLAMRFRALHKRGDPLVLCNVYDAATTKVIASHPGAKAIATASYAIAGVQGLDDSATTFEQALAALKIIAPIAVESGLPFTVDAQDLYGDRLEEVIAALIEMGAVGCNLEDQVTNTGELCTIEAATQRVARAVAAAARHGVPQFVINARTDVLGNGGTIDEVITRGKAYLAAGATTVFVWGGPKGRGTSRAEVVKLVDAFDGMVNVHLGLRSGDLTVKELKEIGVARISLGPELYWAAMKAFSDVADKLLGEA